MSWIVVSPRLRQILRLRLLIAVVELYWDDGQTNYVLIFFPCEEPA